MKTALMRTRQIGRVGLTEGCAFASAALPAQKGFFARNVTIKISSNLHSICLRFPSMCVVNLRKSCGSNCDENSINEYLSNRNVRTYEGLCFCISSCAQKKRVLCSKCDGHSLLQFAHHWPLGSVNAW